MHLPPSPGWAENTFMMEGRVVSKFQEFLIKDDILNFLFFSFYTCFWGCAAPVQGSYT
jgi:hypothetical protein